MSSTLDFHFARLGLPPYDASVAEYSVLLNRRRAAVSDPVSARRRLPTGVSLP